MRKTLILCFFYLSVMVTAQKNDLAYYLPEIKYNAEITTPEEFLGFQIGEWHISHDQVVAYMKLLDAQSDRIKLMEYARTNEHRPLLVLIITSTKNQDNLEAIKKNHLELTNEPNKIHDLSQMPIIVYQGYSIHGNEASGVNAAMLNAYYLAAGEGDEVNKTLKDCVILLDPCFNPDGVQRFSTWVNMHKGQSLITDPISREFNEVWPGGRTNHYWFDLNRDWLYMTHPESKGRVALFQEWRPNILTDHHEMGTNSTFFFQPGVPSRVNGNTPTLNQELTAEIGQYHANALDAIGSQYFTKKNYDDFYYGKGSTYPDIQGSIGILFEQASSRGHLQESDNGLLSFSFAIRNQIVTSLSTQQAAVAMREKLLNYQSNFFVEKRKKLNSASVKGYVIKDRDQTKLNRVLEILHAHEIDIYPLNKSTIIDNINFPANSSYYLPLDQRQGGLLKATFEKVLTFQDSIFYDVSTWTMPLAFDIDYAEVKSAQIIDTNDRLTNISAPQGTLIHAEASYGWIMRWDQFLAAKALAELHSEGIMTKVINEGISVVSNGQEQQFYAGDILVQIQNQNRSKSELQQLITDLVSKFAIHAVGVDTGLGKGGISLGNPDVKSLTKPQAFTIIGDGIRSYDAGELWHYFDTHLGIPLTMIDKGDLTNANLNRYNTLILVDGSYRDISDATSKRIEDWIKSGGMVISMESASNWLSAKSWIKQEENEPKAAQNGEVNYSNTNNASFASEMPGTIFEATMDLTHPLAYGYTDDKMYLFVEDNTFVKPSIVGAACPLIYTASPLISGYAPRGSVQKAANSAAVTLYKIGKGRAIVFSTNLLFRGFWWGNYKMMDNAIFFGNTIVSRALQSE